MHRVFNDLVAQGRGFAATAKPSRHVMESIRLFNWRIIASYGHGLYACIDATDDGNTYLIKGDEQRCNAWVVPMPLEKPDANTGTTD
jgi:hypothetical protein